jgi:hypothetical protein
MCVWARELNRNVPSWPGRMSKRTKWRPGRRVIFSADTDLRAGLDLRSSFLVAAILTLAGVETPVRPSDQPASLVLTVVDSLSRNTLPNADVTDLGGGQNRITDEQGRAYLSWPSDGRLVVRVRQIGYQPREIVVQRSSVGNATTVGLNKIAYVLADVRATGQCSTQADTTMRALSIVALGQLKQAAEKYNEFRRAYPFEVSIERRSAAVPPSGTVKRIVVSQEKSSSEKLDVRYRPGDVIEHRWGEFTVPLLLISTLADSVFWKHHCFVARGFESFNDDRVVRLEFFPTADVEGPDYKGAALLDSATSMLLRVEFHLANPPRRNGPTRLDGYTTFMSPSPFVVLPDTTGAMWWVRDSDPKDTEKPEYMQALYLKELRYRKGKPPGNAAVPP